MKTILTTLLSSCCQVTHSVSLGVIPATVDRVSSCQHRAARVERGGDASLKGEHEKHYHQYHRYNLYSGNSLIRTP